MKKIIFILTFFLLLYTPYIVEAKENYNIIEEIDTQSTFDAEKILNDAKDGKIPFTFKSVLEKIAEIFIGGIKENIPNVIKISVVAILSGLIINLVGEKNDMGTYVAAMIVSTIAIKIFSYSVTLVNETIDSLTLFISSMITPLMTAMAVGTPSMSGATATVFVSMQIFVHICKTYVLPLVCIICVLSAVDKSSPVSYLSGICKLLKQILKWGTGFMITAYSVIVALQTKAASGLDSLAGKSIKYAVGSFVPVVGGALSDSLETVIASTKTMAGALGITGVIGIFYICIIPLVNILCISLSFKIAGAIVGGASENKVADVIKEFSENVERAFLILLSCAVMFLISLAMLCGFGG